MKRANNYWIFNRENFIDMWDDWHRGTIDPRKRDVDEYRENTENLWLLTRSDIIAMLAIALAIIAIATMLVWKGWWGQ